MKIGIVIPSSGGGEDFNHLITTIEANLTYLRTKVSNLQYFVVFAFNGDIIKPQTYLRNADTKKLKIESVVSKSPGKINAIKAAIKGRSADYLFLLDDDVAFKKELFFRAIREFKKDRKLELVSTQSKVITYWGMNPLRKLIYDTINIRSLRSLYKGKDPFLFGRFIVLKKCHYPIPKEIIVDDIYLSFIYSGKYKIMSDYVYTKGVDKLLKHIKRVILLESGRKQVRAIDEQKYKEIMSKMRRKIDNDKLSKEPIYYRMCFFLYNRLRFVTNNIIANLFTHKSTSWS